MSGPHGPDAVPYELQRNRRRNPPIADHEHPGWCDRRKCTPGRHLCSVTVQGNSDDTNIIVEQPNGMTLVAIERWDRRCDLHAEGALVWPLEEARRVHAALGDLLDRVEAVEP